jgi:hypothetical protein
MRKPPILLALYLALVCAVAPVVYARAIAHVKNATGGLVNDLVIDFGSTTSASNVVVAGVRLSTTSDTLDVLTVTETVLHSEDHSGVFRVMIVCFPGGAQTYTFQTSGSATVGVGAGEFSGTDGCVEDGTSDGVIVTAASSPLAADAPPTVQAGGLAFGTAWSANSANFSCTAGYTCIPTDGTDIGGFGLAQWQIAPSTTTYTSQFTWTGSETVGLAVAGVAAPAVAGGHRSLMLLGVGR